MSLPMSLYTRRARFPAAFLLAASLAAPTPSSAGILVRFLAGPAEDSVARYDVYRSGGPAGGAGRVGSLSAVGNGDTLSWPDSSALRGFAYAYSIRAVDGAGRESDPSETTWVALPRLGLPDTLRSAGGAARHVLSAQAHPLRGRATAVFSLEPADRFLIAHDSAFGALEFRSRTGRGDTARAVVRMSYYGKFADADTLVIALAGSSTTSISGGPSAAPLDGAARLRAAERAYRDALGRVSSPGRRVWKGRGGSRTGPAGATTARKPS